MKEVVISLMIVWAWALTGSMSLWLSDDENLRLRAAFAIQSAMFGGTIGILIYYWVERLSS